MKKITIHQFCAVLLLIAFLLTSGCWSYRELDQLALVTAVGIDPGKQPGDIQLTVQIINPGEVQSGGGGGGESGGGAGGQKPPFIVKSRTGKTIFDAVRNFVPETDRKLYWPDTQVMIIGKEQAKQGVRPVLDYFIRNNEPRPTVWILVADGKAGDVLNAPGELEKVSALEMGQLIEHQSLSSKNVMINMQDFVSRLLSKTTAPIATIIKIDQRQKRISLSGTAVFKEDRLVGQLDGRQTRGLLWVLGKVKSGAIIVNAPGGRAGLEIIRSRTQIKPAFTNGKVKIKVSIREEGNLNCQMSPVELATPEMLKSLARRKATVIRNEINSALAKAKALNADIFEFGDAIHRANPKEWRKLEPNWDQIFPQLQVEVDVRSVIRLVGLTIPPPVPPPE